MLSFRTLLFALAATLAVVLAHPLIVPALPLPINGGGGNGGLLPLPIPGIGNGRSSDNSNPSAPGEVASGNPVGLGIDKRTHFYKAPCVYAEANSELQKKQICYLGQNGLLPLAKGEWQTSIADRTALQACENVGSISKDEAQLHELTYPSPTGHCKLESYSARCGIFDEYGILKGVLKYLLGCKL